MSRPGRTRRSMSYQEGSQTNRAAEPVFSTSTSPDGPYLTILRQPETYKRFRYEDELTQPTVLKGATVIGDDDGNCISPTVMINNVPNQDIARITISTVTANEPFRAHPNGLKGRYCKKSVYSNIRDVHPGNNTCVFDDLRIVRVKSVNYKDALKLRKSLKIDPFQQGFNHELDKDFKMTELRLCFQVTLLRSKKVLAPVVSTPIYNTRRSTKPYISHFSPESGSAKGGAKLIILCTVEKESSDVVFYTKPNGNEAPWERRATGLKLHGSQSLYCFTPAFKDTEIKEGVTVFFELRRRSDGTRSNAVKFQYLPNDSDEELINRKRSKMILPALNLFHQESPQTACGNLSPPTTQDIEELINSLPSYSPADDDDPGVDIEPTFFDRVISTPNPSYNDRRWSGPIQAPSNGNRFINNVPKPIHPGFYRQRSINLPVSHNGQVNSAIMNGNLCTTPNMQPMTKTSQNILQFSQPNWHHRSQNRQSMLTNTDQMPFRRQDMHTAQMGHSEPYNNSSRYGISQNIQWISSNTQVVSNNYPSPGYMQENMQSASLSSEMSTAAKEYETNPNK